MFEPHVIGDLSESEARTFFTARALPEACNEAGPLEVEDRLWQDVSEVWRCASGRKTSKQATGRLLNVSSAWQVCGGNPGSLIRAAKVLTMDSDPKTYPGAAPCQPKLFFAVCMVLQIIANCTNDMVEVDKKIYLVQKLQT